MEKAKIKMVSGWETGSYDADTCCNGGGYWQFAGWALFESGWTVSIEDTSCGGYGTRFRAELTAPDGNNAYSVWVCTVDGAYSTRAKAVYGDYPSEEMPEFRSSCIDSYGVDPMQLIRAAREAISGVAWAHSRFGHYFKVDSRDIPALRGVSLDASAVRLDHDGHLTATVVGKDGVAYDAVRSRLWGISITARNN